MSSMMQILNIAACLILLNFTHLARSQSCYYPDGSLALEDTPCSSSSGVTCCGKYFACLENGVCQVTELAQNNDPSMNANIKYFRGSCTDQTWASPDCPQFCIGTQYANDGGNSMEYCSSNTFCCYGGTCDCSTGFNTTTFDKSAVAYTTIGVPDSATTSTSSSSSSTAESSTSTSSAVITDASTSSGTSTGSAAAATGTASSSPTPTPTPTPSNGGLSTGAKAGIGVGVAFGVLLLAVVGFLFWRTNRQHKELEGLKAQREPLQPTMQDHNRYQNQHQSVMSGPSELSGQVSAAAWAQNQNPAKGYHDTSNNSTSTPSNPSELRA